LAGGDVRAATWRKPALCSVVLCTPASPKA
jgi:hypothetical protein